MSYADKHRKQAVCADPHCFDPGVVLKKIGGQLDWWCAPHAGTLDQALPVR